MSLPFRSVKHPRTSEKGFTFVELIIVIVTMALLFSVGFANYRGYQERQNILSATRVFKGDLRFAQEQALAGVKPEKDLAGNPVTCNQLNGYKMIYPGTNTSTYQVAANCDANSDKIVRATDLKDKFPTVQFNSAFGPVFFNVLGRGVQTPRTITLVDSRTAATLVITVNKGGEIN